MLLRVSFIAPVQHEAVWVCTPYGSIGGDRFFTCRTLDKVSLHLERESTNFSSPTKKGQLCNRCRNFPVPRRRQFASVCFAASPKKERHRLTAGTT